MLQCSTITLQKLLVFHNCCNCALKICDSCEKKASYRHTISQLQQFFYKACEIPWHSFSQNLNIIKISTSNDRCWIRKLIGCPSKSSKTLLILIAYYVQLMTFMYFRFTVMYMYGIAVPNFVSDYYYSYSFFFQTRFCYQQVSVSYSRQ